MGAHPILHNSKQYFNLFDGFFSKKPEFIRGPIKALWEELMRF